MAGNQVMIVQTFTSCLACGGAAVRVAWYSTYRREHVTNRYRCSGCGQVFEQKIEPVKLGKPGSR